MWQLALKGKLKKHKMGMETEVLITNPLYKCSYLLGYSLFLDTQGIKMLWFSGQQ